MSKTVFKAVEISKLGQKVPLDMPVAVVQKAEVEEELEYQGPSIEEIEAEVARMRADAQADVERAEREAKERFEQIRTDAENNAFDRIKKASDEAKQKIAEAELKAREIVSEAELKAKEIMMEAEARLPKSNPRPVTGDMMTAATRDMTRARKRSPVLSTPSTGLFQPPSNAAERLSKTSSSSL